MSGGDAGVAWQAGGGVVDSLVTSATGLRDGDWLEASLVGYCALAETAGGLSDPIGTLVSAGVGWLMEHLAPLNALLDLVAGDPDAVRADAAIWTGVGDRLRETSALHDREVARAAQQWSGAAASAYVDSSRGRRLLLAACAEGADAVAGAHLLAGSLIAGVRQEVRQQVGDVVAWIVKRAPLLASGVATPSLLLRIAARVREVCARLQRLIDTTLDCVEALGARLVDLTGDWQRLAGALSHLGSGVRRLARAEEGGPRIAAGAVRWGLGQAGV